MAAKKAVRTAREARSPSARARWRKKCLSKGLPSCKGLGRTSMLSRSRSRPRRLLSRYLLYPHCSSATKSCPNIIDVCREVISPANEG